MTDERGVLLSFALQPGNLIHDLLLSAIHGNLDQRGALPGKLIGKDLLELFQVTGAAGMDAD